MGKVINKMEAIKIAKKKKELENVKKVCGFVGNLDEVWNHAIKEHNVAGYLDVERLDKSVYNEEIGEGEWIQNQEILVNEKNEYWFMCYEKIKKS
jgi:hypothetical protein